jgi:hypothetical protein
MNGSCPDLLAALRVRMRDLQLDACAIKARVEEIAEVIDMLERPQRRRGRPPGPRAVFTARPRKTDGAAELPLHVDGAAHQPDTDTDPTDTELPL